MKTFGIGPPLTKTHPFQLDKPIGWVDAEGQPTDPPVGEEAEVVVEAAPTSVPKADDQVEMITQKPTEL